MQSDENFGSGGPWDERTLRASDGENPVGRVNVRASERTFPSYRSSSRSILFLLLLAALTANCWASPKRAPEISRTKPEDCARVPEGRDALEPADRRSKNGLLRVSLTIHNSLDPNGHMRYCY